MVGIYCDMLAKEHGTELAEIFCNREEIMLGGGAAVLGWV